MRRSRRFLLLLLLVLVLLLTSDVADARRRRSRSRRSHRRAAARRHRHTPAQRGEREVESPTQSWWALGDEWLDEADERPLEQPAKDQAQEPLLAPGADDDDGQAHSMLVLQWPESLCASERRGCRSPALPNHFTLHGLWPLARHRVHCRSDWDVSRLGAGSLYDNLTRLWPSFLRRATSAFWRHEYEKHGSCLYASVEEYFQAALALHAQHALEHAIKPSLEPRSLDAYSAMVESQLGAQPMLMCRTSWMARRRLTPAPDTEAMGVGIGGDEDGYEADVDDDDMAQAPTREQLLVEVGLCFTRAGRLVHCPPKGRIRRCKRGQPVLMPPTGTFAALEE